MNENRQTTPEVRNRWYSAVSHLARRQGGFVTSRQLAALGVHEGAMRWQAHQGRFIRVHHGVYAVGHVPADPRARAFGAMLAAGEGAALARGSAASFYGVFRAWREPFELLGPRPCRRGGLIVRVSSMLQPRDVWNFDDGYRVTSPARTSLDLAARLTEDRLKAAVEHLRLRHRMNIDDLRDVLARNPGHPGARRLRAVTGGLSKRPSRSNFEREWPAFARRFGLPAHETNAIVAGREVDVLVDGRVIVELDTFETHVLNFTSDRDRDADILAKTGIPTIRVTREQFRQEPAILAKRILRVLATAAGPAGPSRRSEN